MCERFYCPKTYIFVFKADVMIKKIKISLYIGSHILMNQREK